MVQSGAAICETGTGVWCMRCHSMISQAPQLTWGWGIWLLYDRIVHNFVSCRQTALCPAADGVRATGKQLCLADRATTWQMHFMQTILSLAICGFYPGAHVALHRMALKPPSAEIKSKGFPRQQLVQFLSRRPLNPSLTNMSCLWHSYLVLVFWWRTLLARLPTFITNLFLTCSLFINLGLPRSQTRDINIKQRRRRFS